MIRILRLSFAALLTGDFLLLCVAVLLFLILKRVRTRATPSGNDRRRGKTAQEDAEAWRRLQNYNVRDAYGGGDG